MKTKVFMTKPDDQTEWGFDLTKLETGSGHPLVVSQVHVGGLASGKLEKNDQILDIAGTPVEALSREEALNIIKKCCNALFLTVSKCAAQVTSNSEADDDDNAVGNVRHEEQEPHHEKKKNSASQDASGTSCDEKLSAKGEAPSTTIKAMASAIEEAKASPASSEVKFTKQSSLAIQGIALTGLLGSTTLTGSRSELQHSNKPIPTAPPLTKEMIKPHYHRPERKSSDKGEPPGSECRIPEKLLSTMTKPGMKPFTYTPRGVDLDEVMRKARSRRKMNMQQDLERRNQSEVNQMPAWNVGGRDESSIAQSRSFQRLQGWVENVGNQPLPVNVEAYKPRMEEQVIMQPNTSIPSNTFRMLQRQSGYPTTATGVQSSTIAHQAYPYQSPQPRSPAFQPPTYRSATNNIAGPTAPRQPARDREHEPEANKYQGATIPSKSFRMLQQYTTNPPTGSVDLPKPEPSFLKGYISSQPLSIPTSCATVPSKAFKLLQQLSGAPLPMVTQLMSPDIEALSGKSMSNEQRFNYNYQQHQQQQQQQQEQSIHTSSVADTTTTTATTTFDVATQRISHSDF